MPIRHRSSRPCDGCGVEITRNAAGLYHCLTDGCPVSHFKATFTGVIHSIVYCADREEERV